MSESPETAPHQAPTAETERAGKAGGHVKAAQAETPGRDARDAGATTAAQAAGGVRGWLGRCRDRKLASRVPVWASVLIVLAVAVLIEVFVCNFRYWQSRDYQEVVLRDTPITIRKADYSLGFGSLNADVKNIKVVTSGPKDNSSIWLSLSVADQGDSTPYYLPFMQLHSDNERSEVHTVFTYGTVSSIRITVPGDVWGGPDGDTLVASNSFPITIESISINAPVPFSLNPLRLLLLAAACLFVWFLWPGRAPFRVPALSPRLGPTLARVGTLVATLAVLTMFLFTFPKWVGIATESYNTTDYDETDTASIQLTGQPDTATNEYGKLAQAFANGQLYLLQTPPQWLKNMEDPYQYGGRDEASVGQTRGYLWDTAYYDGHYYVYFGVLPCLVFYLPFYLLSGAYFPNSLAVLVATLLFVGGWYALLKAIIRYRFTKASLGTFLLIFLGVTFCSGVLIGLGRASLYNVPVTCARCLAVWGLYLWYMGWHKQSAVRLCAGSLLMALIAATRPQLLILIPLLAVLLWMTLRSRTFTRRRKVGWTLSMVVPVALVAAGVMWYNQARFGSVLDFGANYNLTYNNMTMRGHSLMRVADGLYYYLVNPPAIVNTFPFIGHSGIFPAFAGKTVYEPLMGGIVWLSPMLLALLMLPTLRRGGADGKGDRPLFWMVGYLLVAGLVLVAFDTDGAGILLRYFQDFGFIMGLGAALVFLHHLGGVATTWMPAEYVRLAEAVNPVDPADADRARRREAAKAAKAASDAKKPTRRTSADEVVADAASDAAVKKTAGTVVATDAVVAVEKDAHADGAKGKGDAVEKDGGAAAGRLPTMAPRTPLANGRGHNAWAIALFVCVLLGMVMAVLTALFMWDPVEGGVSGGGSYPEFWEQMRQTFSWWL
ncbi:hypothetical protein I3I95_01345 [bacterium]|nr:hypothetical protein [bacterium]